MGKQLSEVIMLPGIHFSDSMKAVGDTKVRALELCATGKNKHDAFMFG